MELPVYQAVHPDDFKHYDTQTIRQRFLLQTLKQDDEINLAYTHYERMIAGVARPVSKTLELPTYNNLRADYFLERREIGIINVGGAGTVTADEQSFTLQKLDCMYAGRGTQRVTFAANDPADPPVFYLLSTPAHAAYPVTFMDSHGATPTTIGNADTANHRTVYKYIHLEGIKSCQLVMGLTILHTGSIWNTMPAHVHDRRCEIYFYFDVPQGYVVFHYMGQPQETRHMTVQNHQAILSPPWSIHSGSGTASYSFIWGMGGENLVYSDMDVAPIDTLK
jgi:4-deoxy-L-threo-5-hexosulose-uronate ketol-isomerase